MFLFGRPGSQISGFACIVTKVVGKQPRGTVLLSPKCQFCASYLLRLPAPPVAAVASTTLNHAAQKGTANVALVRQRHGGGDTRLCPSERVSGEMAVRGPTLHSLTHSPSPPLFPHPKCADERRAGGRPRDTLQPRRPSLRRKKQEKNQRRMEKFFLCGWSISWFPSSAAMTVGLMVAAAAAAAAGDKGFTLHVRTSPGTAAAAARVTWSSSRRGARRLPELRNSGRG